VDFGEYAAQPDVELELLTGALLVARDAYPNLDTAAQTRSIEELAHELAASRPWRLPLALQASALVDHLYRRHGFRGNETDYHDPKNSFLNEVMERRLGIPISLAVVYVEVARRCGMHANGVGFPGHFLVCVGEGKNAIMIDPFRGALPDRRALTKLLARTGQARRLEEGMLAPTPTRHFVARMLMNLRGIYASRGDYPRLLVVLDRLIDLLPEIADEVRDRGLLWAKLGAPQAALDDLKRYVEALPHAGDAAEVRRLIDQLESQPALVH
jgi:regulator of sirC expression with transglutaminase-like and TPR domain